MYAAYMHRDQLYKWVLKKAKRKLKEPVETTLEIAIGFLALAILTVEDMRHKNK